ncbi:hypothetical protein [Paenibacillus daejeonensis]|uniref:hypothetical protein n=1 Tax=Paenibacillus daejeonensis TaxID=135193 RepID=UPI00037F4A14|nr:hypothetical protein [Paenibacillus daejeonensis]
MIVISFLLFMFFSTIEGLSIYAVALYVFRFDFRKYFWHSLLIIEIINLQNYLTREELISTANMGAIAPIVNLLITALFFTTIVRIPILWSFLMTIVGFASVLVLQTLVLNVLISFEDIQAAPMKGYIMQFLPVTLILITAYLYRRGYGFTFDFEKLRFKREHVLIIALIVLFILFLFIVMQLLNVFVGLIGFVISLLIFLIYSFRKEAGEH